jgi:type II secretory pathway component GspD/PulD (secretin)
MNTRNKLILSAVLGALTFAAPSLARDGQTPTTPLTVSVSSNGNDVRTVLKDLFSQSKQNYVIEPNIHFAVYLSLEKVDFDETLAIVLHLAKLKAEKVNGIYYVSEDLPATTAKSTPPPTTPAQTKAAAPALQVGPPPVTQTTLKTKKVTTRLAKADIRRVFEALSKESGIPITVDISVPQYKIDAFLEKTSLKYAMDQITTAAKLRYRIVDKQSILVFTDETENRVSVVTGP